MLPMPMLPSLVANGLDRLNLSLDTLDRQRFVQLTRRDGLKRVLDAIDLALSLGLEPLKVNCVLMAGKTVGGSRTSETEGGSLLIVAFRRCPRGARLTRSLRTPHASRYQRRRAGQLCRAVP